MAIAGASATATVTSAAATVKRRRPAFLGEQDALSASHASVLIAKFVSWCRKLGTNFVI